jgi:DNA-binding response OmpR family regulator
MKDERFGYEHVAMILLVEDMDEARAGMKWLLEKQGYKVIAAPSEEIASNLMLDRKPNLILIETGQTREQMLAAGRRIRERVGIEDTQIVVISSESDIETDYIRLNDGEYVTMMDGFDQLEHLLADVIPIC